MGEVLNEFLSVRIKRTMADGLTVYVRSTPAIEELFREMVPGRGTETTLMPLGASRYAKLPSGQPVKCWSAALSNKDYTDDPVLYMVPFACGSSDAEVVIVLGSALSRTTAQIRQYCADLRTWCEDLIEQRLRPLEFSMTASAKCRKEDKP